REESIQKTNRRIAGQLEKLGFLSGLLTHLENANSILNIEDVLTQLIFGIQTGARVRILPAQRDASYETAGFHRRTFHFTAKGESYILLAMSPKKITSEQSKKIKLTLPTVSVSVERIESMRQV